MVLFLLGIIIFGIVFLAVSAVNSAKYGTGRKVSVKFQNTESGRTVHAGNGNSIGSAIADGFRKMADSVSSSSSMDTLDSKLNAMRKTLSEYQRRMKDQDIQLCYSYMRKVENLQKEKRKILEERERSLPAQRRFVAEQRRLMTDSLRYDVLKRDGFRCQICGATAKDGYKLHVDHIVPVSKGGKTELSNLRTLCERCNMGKSDKLE